MIRIALLFIIAALAGCGYDPIKYSGLGTDPAGAEHALDVMLNPVCKIGDGDAASDPQMRLLRAHLVIGIVARYGAARTEDYSDDRPGDAGRILTRTEIALRALERALKSLDSDPSLFNMRRADLVLATLQQAEAAAKPTVRTLIGFMRMPTVSDARNLIENALEDKLYKEAYRADCGILFKSTASLDKSAREKLQLSRWKLTEGHMVEQCARLTHLTSGEHKCALTPGTYPFGTVPKPAAS